MKKLKIILSAALISIGLVAFAIPEGKLVSSKTHIKFYSHTVVEDIEAHNYAAVSTINTETGVVVFSVPMQGFEFEKSLMQKHYNSSKFLDTKAFPKAKLKARIINISDINFTKDGIYKAKLEGNLTIKDVSKSVEMEATITITGNKIEVDSKFNIKLVDYGVTFVKGKPASNIAKTVEVTVIAEYQSE